MGLDLMTGEPMLPEQEGVWDNYCVKRQSLHLSTVRAATRARQQKHVQTIHVAVWAIL